MRAAPNAPRRPRVLDHRLVFAVGFVALLVSCDTATSRLTGVTPDRARPTTCIHYCNDLYTTLVAQEQKLRDANLGECRVLPQPQRGACLDEEGTRHAAEMARLEELRAACLSSCSKPTIPG